MAGQKNDDATRSEPPRQTYIPKPPSEEEVEQVSREQAMVTDDWTGESSASEGGETSGDTESPRRKGGA